jgi:hypothetical protein
MLCVRSLIIIITLTTTISIIIIIINIIKNFSLDGRKSWKGVPYIH